MQYQWASINTNLLENIENGCKICGDLISWYQIMEDELNFFFLFFFAVWYICILVVLIFSSILRKNRCFRLLTMILSEIDLVISSWINWCCSRCIMISHGACILKPFPLPRHFFHLSFDVISDIDECSANIHNCSKDNATCANTRGSFNCSCNPGYVGDGHHCQGRIRQSMTFFDK